MAQATHRSILLAAYYGLGALLVMVPGAAVAPVAEPTLLACSPAEEPAPKPRVAPAAPDPVRQALVRHLSRRFTIAPGPTTRIVETAYRAAQRAGLDPFLVLAVISVESRFNPIAESLMGAKGLMQIIPKYHREKLALHGGDEAVLDPVSNILVGTEILREYLRRKGSLQAALQYYNGASRDESARYTRKVMAERRRLEQVAQGASI